MLKKMAIKFKLIILLQWKINKNKLRMNNLLSKYKKTESCYYFLISNCDKLDLI